MSLPITPATRVGALLEAYPGIEEVLIACAPAFAKLRNPVLRATVARVATLEQAARIGGIGVRELVCKLRQATGQGDNQEPVHAGGGESCAAQAPSWLKVESVRHRIDADSLLERGEHPFGAVRQRVAKIGAGEVVCVSSSFYPAPLIDALRKSGLAVYSAETEAGRHETFICSPRS